ncbi:MAG: hypothetical protein K2W95_00295 [Candidatus Obscuribacterales bacterium]|nr:hypothetical protein [Candidatus Obscuribacterales bacterium]
MVTLKHEKEELVFPGLRAAGITLVAVLFAILFGALLYFKSPGSMRTSPNAQHNPVAQEDKTNAPHFAPTRNTGQPESPEGTTGGQLMAPGRYLPAPAPGGAGNTRNKDFRMQAPPAPLPESAR